MAITELKKDSKKKEMQAFEALGVARICFGIFWLLLWLISWLCCREFETLSANVPDRTR